MTNIRSDFGQLVADLPGRPGVYRMIDGDGNVIYVGKAKNIRKRVSSYFRTGLDVKTHVLIRKVVTIDVTVTSSEAEALLLENNLIKSLKPRYNIVLRDDKSYPYIYRSNDEFPRFSFYRGSRKEKGSFFGPYASAGAVRETLQLLQKLFPVRQCENSFFNNRSRPCLQHQLKRCTAPCVGLIDKGQYAQDVLHAEMFLTGKSHELSEHMLEKMEQAASGLAFEDAARYRDQVAALRKIQQKQYASTEHGNCDVVAACVDQGLCCVQLFQIRNGLNLGNRHYFPKLTTEHHGADVLAAFMPLHYLNKNVPPEIVVNASFDGLQSLQQVLCEQMGKTITIRSKVRGERAQWLAMAEKNAQSELARYLASRLSLRRRFESLQLALHLDAVPERLECFDVSHTMGERPVASCVVFDQNGPLKSDYRRFKIRGVTPGDDYLAMRQAMERRFTRGKQEQGSLPDILFIDGGKGQLRQAEEVLQELGMQGIVMVGIAKGVERKPGKEVLFLSPHGRPVILPSNSLSLHLIQQIRDEAHRFAITGHRMSRDKARKRSALEDIPGVGSRRRQSLLRFFGGMQALVRASTDDIAKVPGISRQLAETIYETLHDQ